MMFASTSPNQRAQLSSLLLCLAVASGVAGAPPAATKPRTTLTLDLGQGCTLELVRIPAGTFQMGSPADEPGRDPDEHAHRVRITRPFYLGRTEVTQQQWQAVMTDDPSTFTGDPLRPVESVTWAPARAFCRRLSRRAGRTVTLPTEAQWEYACRAGSQTPYALGAEIEPRDATDEELAWVHPRKFRDELIRICADGPSMVDMDTYVQGESYAVALTAATQGSSRSLRDR